MPVSNSRLAQVFEKREQEIIEQWLEQQLAAGRKLTAAERENSDSPVAGVRPRSQ